MVDEDIPQPVMKRDPTIHLPEEILDMTQGENNKYWLNRFLYGKEYIEFVNDMLLYWNSSNIITQKHSCRNDDNHIFGLKPKDYYSHKSFFYQFSKEEMMEIKASPQEI